MNTLSSHVSKRIDTLKKIYTIYDVFASKMEMSCKPKCAACCTRNVAVTSIEGQFILEHISDNKLKLDLEPEMFEFGRKRFHPEFTTNRLADLCANGKEIPEETMDSKWGKCPFLSDDLCDIYPARPFGCRGMVSKEKCSEDAYALMDEFSLTVNNLLMQCIEHMDANGASGNLIDMLFFLGKDKGESKYKNGGFDIENTRLIRNQPAKTFLVPPEHKYAIGPIFAEIGGVLSGAH